MQDLKKWFGKARVPVNIEKEPISSSLMSVNNQDIFQMTIGIRGKTNKREYFRIFYGNENNDIRVIDTDSKNQQLILLVSETEREYKVRQWDRKKGDWIYIKQKSPGFLRKYLMGMDECHLFISELPNNLGLINKIKDAHKVLKPDIVIINEKVTNRIKRQGEWFFIPITELELSKIKKNSDLIEKKMLLGTYSLGRNSHVADLFIKIKGVQFVKGKISHIEHKTLKLNGWYKVVRNNEARTTTISGNQILNGVKWVD